MGSVPFNIPTHTGNEIDFIREAIDSHKICGDGAFTARCSRKLEELTGSPKVLLTTSCTHALELAALLCNIGPDDEVIMPSYTFVSTANAFVLRGAKIVFVDIRPDTMNLDETLIEAAITSRTKAIVPVHYAGVACEMDAISQIAKKHGLFVIEDAAQGVMASYHERSLGTLGDLGCFSFHETKNYSMGEGGALLIQNPELIKRAEILREKGTNRSQFLRGQVDKYTWVDIGSSYLPSELNAAYLWPQLLQATEIRNARMSAWQQYATKLAALAGYVDFPLIPVGCMQNGHMFYIKTRDIEERTALISFLKAHGVQSAFHYVPLHSAPAGLRWSWFYGEDRFTTRESERLLRLPMYYGLSNNEIDLVCSLLFRFFTEESR